MCPGSPKPVGTRRICLFPVANGVAKWVSKKLEVTGGIHG